MSRLAEASESVAGVTPAAIIAAWVETDRWSAIVDGFSRIVERSSDWPAPRSFVIWESGGGGRGRVSEEVEAHDPAGRFATMVADPQLAGTQTLMATVVPTPDGGETTRVELVLDYELTGASMFQSLMDSLFIRRALRDSLRRTVAGLVAEVEPDDEPQRK